MRSRVAKEETAVFPTIKMNADLCRRYEGITWKKFNRS
jgi:hypothetical protein